MGRIAFIADLAALAEKHPGEEETILKVIRELLGAPLMSSPTVGELGIARSQGKIEAIKAFRGRTGASLKEAKDAIEEAASLVGILFPSYGGNTQ